MPRPLHYCEDESVLGSAFYLMEYVPGSVHVSATLPGLDATVRKRIYQDSSRLLAALNEIDLQAARIEDYARPEGYWARLVKRWTEQYGRPRRIRARRWRHSSPRFLGPCLR